VISAAGSRVELIDVRKTYRTAAGEVTALAGVHASFAVFGPRRAAERAVGGQATILTGDPG
jgi:hypothetical protein